MANKNFADKLKKRPQAISEETSAAPSEVSEQEKRTQTTNEKKAKRKPGRPPLDPSGKKKKDYTKTINIAVPLELLEKLDTVKICYDNNLTLYINKLIEKDIEAHYDEYRRVADTLNNFK